MRGRFLSISLLMAALTTSLAAEGDKRIYLKRPSVKGGLSSAEADTIAAAFQGKLSLLLLQRGGYAVVNDDDLSSLLEEAETKAALDCDASECLLAIADMIGAQYLVRTSIAGLAGGKARVDAQFSQRAGDGQLRLLGVADVPDCDLRDEEQVNWYAREIISALLDPQYSVRPYLPDRVGVSLQLATTETLRIDALGRQPLGIVVNLPEVKVEASAEAAREVAAILKQEVSAADALLRALEREPAEQSYRKVLDKTNRYRGLYPEIGAFEAIVTERIGEVRRLTLEDLIGRADTRPGPVEQLAGYREAQRFLASVESQYASAVLPHSALVADRVALAHRRILKGHLDKGDERFRAGDTQAAMENYRAASVYLEANQAEIERSGEDATESVVERLLLCWQSAVGAVVKEAEFRYMEYDFARAEDGFTAAAALATSMPMYSKLMGTGSDRGSWVPTPGIAQAAERLRSVLVSARRAADTSRSTSLNILRNQAALYRDRVVIFDARDEKDQASRVLEDMGAYIGSNRYRDDPVALTCLHEACRILGRTADAMLLATPEVRAVVNERGGAVDSSRAHLSVARSLGTAQGVAVSWTPAGQAGANATTSTTPTDWIAVPAGDGVLEVGPATARVRLLAGHFYRITADVPSVLPPLEHAAVLHGCIAPPSQPVLRPEERRAWDLSAAFAAGEIAGIGAGLGAVCAVGLAALRRSAGQPLADQDFTIASAVGAVAGSLLVIVPTGWLLSDRTVARPLAVRANAARMDAWRRSVERAESANRRLLDAENERREKANREAIELWKAGHRSAPAAVERAARGTNPSAETVLPVSEGSTGSLTMVDIGSFLPPAPAAATSPGNKEGQP